MAGTLFFQFIFPIFEQSLDMISIKNFNFQMAKNESKIVRLSICKNFLSTYSLTKLNNLNQDASRSYLAIFWSYNALKFSLI